MIETQSRVKGWRDKLLDLPCHITIPMDEARICSHQLDKDIAAAMWSDYNVEHIYRGLDPIDE